MGSLSLGGSTIPSKSLYRARTGLRSLFSALFLSTMARVGANTELRVFGRLSRLRTYVLDIFPKKKSHHVFGRLSTHVPDVSSEKKTPHERIRYLAPTLLLLIEKNEQRWKMISPPCELGALFYGSCSAGTSKRQFCLLGQISSRTLICRSSPELPPVSCADSD